MYFNWFTKDYNYLVKVLVNIIKVIDELFLMILDSVRKNRFVGKFNKYLL